MSETSKPITTPEELREQVVKRAFGMTPQEAWHRGICLKCKEEAAPRFYSLAGVKEYWISALCEPCFGTITRGYYEQKARAGRSKWGGNHERRERDKDARGL